MFSSDLLRKREVLIKHSLHWGNSSLSFIKEVGNKGYNATDALLYLQQHRTFRGYSCIRACTSFKVKSAHIPLLKDY